MHACVDFQALPASVLIVTVTGKFMQGIAALRHAAMVVVVWTTTVGANALAADLAPPEYGSDGLPTGFAYPATDAPFFAVVDLHQQGDDNRIDIVQQDGASSAQVFQYGTGNRADISQQGTGHTASIVQEGNANAFSLTQSGTGQHLDVTQWGDGLSVQAAQR